MAKEQITSVPRDEGWRNISNPKKELSLKQIQIELNRKGNKNDYKSDKN